MESLKFAHEWQQVVLQEYIDAVKAASKRVADITAQMERVLPQWSLAPVVASLVALRGIDTLAAMVLLAFEIEHVTGASAAQFILAYAVTKFILALMYGRSWREYPEYR